VRASLPGSMFIRVPDGGSDVLVPRLRVGSRLASVSEDVVEGVESSGSSRKPLGRDF
jgi:hypothetical protein